VDVREDMLIVDLGVPRRCLSSAVLGGGLGWVRTWLNLQVPSDYARTDVEEHLREVSAELDWPVAGMLTAAPVGRFTEGRFGGAIAIATVGVRHALAAASERPRPAPRVGTINLFVLTHEPLTDAGLVGALQTAVEAKAQALAEARIPARNARGFATGTATDSILIACPPGARVPFAGPATSAGGDIARAVHRAVLVGALAEHSSPQEVWL
jgi:adenosylcobinamide amidohydrolase